MYPLFLSVIIFLMSCLAPVAYAGTGVGPSYWRSQAADCLTDVSTTLADNISEMIGESAVASDDVYLYTKVADDGGAGYLVQNGEHILLDSEFVQLANLCNETVASDMIFSMFAVKHAGSNHIIANIQVCAAAFSGARPSEAAGLILGALYGGTDPSLYISNQGTHLTIHQSFSSHQPGTGSCIAPTEQVFRSYWENTEWDNYILPQLLDTFIETLADELDDAGVAEVTSDMVYEAFQAVRTGVDAAGNAYATGGYDTLTIEESWKAKINASVETIDKYMVYLNDDEYVMSETPFNMYQDMPARRPGDFAAIMDGTDTVDFINLDIFKEYKFLKDSAYASSIQGENWLSMTSHPFIQYVEEGVASAFAIPEEPVSMAYNTFVDNIDDIDYVLETTFNAEEPVSQNDHDALTPSTYELVAASNFFTHWADVNDLKDNLNAFENIVLSAVQAYAGASLGANKFSTIDAAGLSDKYIPLYAAVPRVQDIISNANYNATSGVLKYYYTWADVIYESLAFSDFYEDAFKTGSVSGTFFQDAFVEGSHQLLYIANQVSSRYSHFIDNYDKISIDLLTADDENGTNDWYQAELFWESTRRSVTLEEIFQELESGTNTYAALEALIDIYDDYLAETLVDYKTSVLDRAIGDGISSGDARGTEALALVDTTVGSETIAKGLLEFYNYIEEETAGVFTRNVSNAFEVDIWEPGASESVSGEYVAAAPDGKQYFDEPFTANYNPLANIPQKKHMILGSEFLDNKYSPWGYLFNNSRTTAASRELGSDANLELGEGGVVYDSDSTLTNGEIKLYTDLMKVAYMQDLFSSDSDAYTYGLNSGIGDPEALTYDVQDAVESDYFWAPNYSDDFGYTYDRLVEFFNYDWDGDEGLYGVGGLLGLTDHDYLTTALPEIGDYLAATDVEDVLTAVKGHYTALVSESSVGAVAEIDDFLSPAITGVITGLEDMFDLTGDDEYVALANYAPLYFLYEEGLAEFTRFKDEYFHKNGVYGYMYTVPAGADNWDYETYPIPVNDRVAYWMVGTVSDSNDWAWYFKEEGPLLPDDGDDIPQISKEVNSVTYYDGMTVNSWRDDEYELSNPGDLGLTDPQYEDLFNSVWGEYNELWYRMYYSWDNNASGWREDHTVTIDGVDYIWVYAWGSTTDRVIVETVSFFD